MESLGPTPQREWQRPRRPSSKSLGSGTQPANALVATVARSAGTGLWLQPLSGSGYAQIRDLPGGSLKIMSFALSILNVADKVVQSQEPCPLVVRIGILDGLRHEELESGTDHLVCLPFGYARLKRKKMLFRYLGCL